MMAIQDDAVCLQWRDFRVFATWVQENLGLPSPGPTRLDDRLHLARTDLSRNWEPGNVRWVFRDRLLYYRWRAMIARCEDPGATGYPRHGGRGTRVCAAWHEFRPFAWWVQENLGLPARPRLVLARIDWDRDYKPGNVRWADRNTEPAAAQYLPWGSHKADPRAYNRLYTRDRRRREREAAAAQVQGEG
jgi:hypothetical protein